LDELLLALFVLSVVVTVVTLVGHGIWVLVTWLLRGGRTVSQASDPAKRNLPPRPSTDRTATACPRCGCSLSATTGQCAVCDWPGPVSDGQRRREVFAELQGRLARFAALGAIDTDTRRDLDAALRARLVGDFVDSEVVTAEIIEPGAAHGPHAPPLSPQVATESQSPSQPPPSEPPSRQPTGPPADRRETGSRQRARRYAAARARAEAEVALTDVPKPPRRETSEVLAAFMQERNIRWGELVGGLLIVCCSIALVISFWSDIAERPLLKFVIFNGVSAALFGAGFYTLRRWQIHTTSRGLLIIATLLVPLNFLAIAAFTQQAPPTDLFSISGELLSLGMFTTLTYMAARVLAPSALLLTTSVMLTSLMQLVTRRFSGDDFSLLAVLYFLAVVPVGCYVGTTGLAIARLWRAADKTADDHRQTDGWLFILLGVASFATLLPLGLLVYQSGAIVDTLSRLAPLVTVCGLPALATGLLHWGRASRPDTATKQTVGIGVGVAGAIVMAIAIGLAWHDPALLLSTTLTTAALFAMLAVAFEISAAHLVTAACLSVAWLVGFHVARGSVAWHVSGGEELSGALLSAASGNALVPLAGLFAGVAFAFNRVGRIVDAFWYVMATAATVVVSLALTVGFGFARDGDPFGVTWTLGLYAVAAAVAAVFTRRDEVAWGASALLLAALVQGAVFRYADALEPAQPWIVATLGHATLVALAGVVIIRHNGSATWTIAPYRLASNQLALFRSALATSVVAVGLLVVDVAGVAPYAVTSYATAVYLAWTATVWLVLATAANWPAVFATFQFTLFLALANAVHGAVEYRDWYFDVRQGWLDPWAIEAKGIALAAYCALWTAIRIVMWKLIEAGSNTNQTLKRAGELLRARTSAVDRWLEVAATLLLLGVVIYGVAPGVAEELAPTARADRVAVAIDRIETNNVAHVHATDRGAWLLLVAVAAMVTVGMWRDFVTERVVALVITAGLGCGLVATAWEAQTATASALRWTMAGYVLLASVPIWARQRVQSTAARLGINVVADRPTDGLQPVGQSFSRHVSIDASARATIIAVVLLVYAAMGVYVGGAAVLKAGLPGGMQTTLYGLGGVCLVMLIVVAVLARLERATPSESRSKTLAWSILVSQALLMMGLAPMIAAGIFVVADALRQFPIIGPTQSSWFAEIGLSVSYGVPIVGMSVVLLGHGVRQRSSAYTLAAALLVNLVATTVYLIQRAAAGNALDGEAWVGLAQINAIAGALFSLAWLVVWTQYQSRAAGDDDAVATVGTPPSLLGQYIAFGTALCGAVVLWAAAYLSVYPAAPGNVAVAGSRWGWIALALNAACVVWLARRYHVRHTLVSLTGVLGVTASMLAFTVAQWDGGHWLAFHTLLAGCGVAAMTTPSLARVWAVMQDWRLTATGVRLATTFATVTVLLSLRALGGDPQTPWWTVGGLSAMAALFAVLAWEVARRRHVWAPAVLLNLAASIWWVEAGSGLLAGSGRASLRDLVYINTIAAAVTAVYSVVVQRRRIDPREHTGGGTLFDVRLHRVAVWVMMAVMLLGISVGLLADVLGETLWGNKTLSAVAVVAVIVALVARLWDPRSRYTVACLYSAGALGMGALVDGLDIADTSLLLWDATLCAAAYALLTSYLWSRRVELIAWFARHGVPLAVESQTWRSTNEQPGDDQPNYIGHTWLVTTNGMIAGLVTAAVFWIECTFASWPQRNAAAYALAALTYALALLARSARRSALQYVSLVSGVLFAVAFGLSWLAPTVDGGVFDDQWLNRLIVAVVAVAAAVPLYGFGMVKLCRQENEWTRAAERLVPSLVTLGSVLLVVVLGMELYHFMEHGHVPVNWPARIAVAIALAGMGVAALAAAVVPGRDPLGLSEGGRTAYVYAAEIIAALLFVHVRVTVPELFRGWFLQFWPLVAMGIAFAGVGFSEWCARRRQPVLSRPLEKTAALLPILPVMGFWVVDSQVNFSLLLLSVGALYAVLAVLRRSFGFSILAIIAANGSLWRLLGTHEGLGLAQHPQLWLIPPAVCVLVASYLNRSRLSQQQMTSIRYFSAIVIYAASTADIFLNGIANAPWLPGVLAVLAIAGIFAGIMLRVRAFLFLGTTFLMVSLMTVIWHAAVELRYTFIWYVSGIFAGVLIIVLFGLFEKRRDDVLRVVDNVRRWDA
jgi:hypothetical protein